MLHLLEGRGAVMIWPSSRRRAAASAAVLLWVWTLLMWGATPLATAQPGPPAGAVRIMDGTHNQLARVNHTGQLAVDASVTVDTISHLTSVTHVTGTMRLSDIAGNVVGVTSNALNVSVGGGGLAVNQSGSWTILATHQAGEWNIRHVSGAVHVVSAGLWPANQAAAVRCVNTAGTAFEACGGATEGAGVSQSGSWTVQAAHQGGNWNIGHISSVSHVFGFVRIVNSAGTNAAFLNSTSLSVSNVGGQ